MAGYEQRLQVALDNREFQEVAAILDNAELEVRWLLLRVGRCVA